MPKRRGEDARGFFGPMLASPSQLLNPNEFKYFMDNLRPTRNSQRGKMSLMELEQMWLMSR
jgi:hypothetical protein